MLDLQVRSSEGPSFEEKVRKDEGKIRSRNVTHGRALHDHGRETIYVF